MRHTKSMTITEFRNMIGLEHDLDWNEYLKSVVIGDDDCYAVCEYECQVEPDGYCEHGYPSVLIKIGII